MDEQDPLERLAEKYRHDGYEVLIRPEPDQLPAFLEGAPVDILARKGDHIVALKVAERSGNSDAPVWVEADLGVDSIFSLLQEAETLLNPRTMRAAFVMAWAAFEATARGVLQPSKTAFAAASPRQMVEELHSRQLVSGDEFKRLQECLYLRNAVVHGALPGELPPDAVPFLLSLARQLMRKMEGGSRRITSTVSPAILRGRVNRSPEMKSAVEHATEALSGLLGPSLGSVSVEWDLAEDARRRSVLVLKLSDQTGEVTATFEPWELEDEEQLRTRLNHLWGDLLEIRSHKQVQRLFSAAGK